MYSVSEANGRGWMLLVTLVVAALIGVEGVSAQEEHDKAVQADEGSESQAVPEGKGSRYQTTYKDSEGRPLDGNKTYKLNVLPKVPVALFWAVTVYDPWTRSEIQSQPYPSISSQQTPAPTTNDDGSIDIYFSTAKPEDIAAQNWVKTLPDQGFFVYIRYYGPLNAFNEKTWIPNDVELVK